MSPILMDLRSQHEEFSRIGYDGHNRRPVGTTMRQLRMRRSRRTARRSLVLFVRRFESIAA